MKRPLVSVVLVTWNRRQELEPALDSIFRQTIADRIETIVIDNCSDDDTVEWLAEQYPHPVRLFQFHKNLGASAGRNAGIRLARGHYVCFLDSDAEIESTDAIEQCVKFLRGSSNVRACSGLIWMDRDHTRPFTLGAYITPEGHFDGNRTRTETEDPDFISTCFAVWERKLLLELRGFDPWYFWGIEDMDLSLRARFNAKRGKRKAATEYRILNNIHILHEMSREGRHYQPDDFHRVFHSIERQRLYLVNSYGGLREMLRVILLSPLNIRRIEQRAWEQKLSWTKRMWALLLYPTARLLYLPWDSHRRQRNFLRNCPMPYEVLRKRK